MRIVDEIDSAWHAHCIPCCTYAAVWRVLPFCAANAHSANMPSFGIHPQAIKDKNKRAAKEHAQRQASYEPKFTWIGGKPPWAGGMYWEGDPQPGFQPGTQGVHDDQEYPDAARQRRQMRLPAEMTSLPMRAAASARDADSYGCAPPFLAMGTAPPSLGMLLDSYPMHTNSVCIPSPSTCRSHQHHSEWVGVKSEVREGTGPGAGHHEAIRRDNAARAVPQMGDGTAAAWNHGREPTTPRPFLKHYPSSTGPELPREGMMYFKAGVHRAQQEGHHPCYDVPHGRNNKAQEGAQEQMDRRATRLEH